MRTRGACDERRAAEWSERGDPHHVSATRPTKVDVSTASKGAASERGPSPDGVGRNPYRGKASRIVEVGRTSRCCAAEAILATLAHAPRETRAARRSEGGDRDVRGSIELRARVPNTPHARLARSAEAKPRVVKRTVPRPCCAERPQASRCSSKSASFKSERRVPTLSSKREARASDPKAGNTRDVSARRWWFGWQKSVERIAVERPHRVERHEADSVTWLAGTRGSPQLTRALGGRAGENGAEQRDVGHSWPPLVTRSACASVVAFESSGGRARWLGCHTGREHAVVGHDEGVSDRACAPS